MFLMLHVHMKPVIGIISWGGVAPPKPTVLTKRCTVFATMDRFLKFWQLWKAEIQPLRMKLAEFLYSRSAMSKIEQGCGRSGFGHFFRVHFFQFLSLKSSPDRFLDPGILLLPSSSYFLAIPLLRSRAPHLVQKLCNMRCATPPSD